VLALFGLSSIYIECVCQRLSWLSSVARDPSHHKLFLSVLLGSPARFSDVQPKHPHYKQLISDLEHCRFVESLAEFCTAFVTNPTLLFTDVALNALFGEADFAAIKQRSISTNLAPPALWVDPPPASWSK
jgi:hypothetical protein